MVDIQGGTIQEDGSFTLTGTVTPQGDDVADTVVIHGLSNDITVQAGNGASVYAIDNGDGTTDYVVPVDALGNVTIHPPADWAGNIPLTITATAVTATGARRLIQWSRPRSSRSRQ